jgi:hypothetical protein
MAYNVTEYLTQIQELTKKNFELLKALNNAFYTKSEHLSVTLDNTQYVIPSFLSLENKINTLTDNFENLVNAPKTGEAVFDFDGNTQSIEVKGFTNVPNTAFEGLSQAPEITTFDVKKNQIFKDFLTPTPYIKIDLSHLPNEIQQVNVKKIAISNTNAITLLKNAAEWVVADSEKDTTDSVCRPIKYSDVKKILYNYISDTDYVEYDKTYTMPLRYEIGTGKYSILSIVENWTDDNFYEHYKLKLDKLSYTIADNTIEKTIQSGDYFVTNNDKCKLLIENVNTSTRVVQVKVENGAYADLCTADDENVDLSTLKFYAIGNIDYQKYLEIPLEEDQYVMVFLAPIQRNSLIQSAWSTGLLFNVYALTKDNQDYKSYYDQMITNIGDKLFGIVSMVEKDFVNVGNDEYNKLVTSKPVIDTDQIKVTLINKHMSNSETVQEIYKLYKQKQDYKTSLDTVQNEIDDINATLNKLSFETENSNIRKTYSDKLSELQDKKNNIISSISSTIQQITNAAADTDTPVDNPKYHIRGFFDYNTYLNTTGLDKHNIIKIDIQYRYKNANKVIGNAETIGTNSGIYSDWNIMQSEYSYRIPKLSGNTYTYNYKDDTTTINEPSFNQIDIPISQGETVDMRLRVVYAVGYPFVKCTSEWSDIVNIEFPIELRKNITVLDILEENNSDTQKEVFRSYLNKAGVLTHTGDSIVDQNVTFFHTPEHISSGFKTDEQRIIPLYDKLKSLTDAIASLEDDVNGSKSENLLVTLSDSTGASIVLSPYVNNTFSLTDYESAEKSRVTSTFGSATDIAEDTLTLTIQNTSKSKNIKLFSIFPGSYTEPLTEYAIGRYTVNDYFATANNTSSNITSTIGSSGSTSGSDGSAGAINTSSVTNGGLFFDNKAVSRTLNTYSNKNKQLENLNANLLIGSQTFKNAALINNANVIFTGETSTDTTSTVSTVSLDISSNALCVPIGVADTTIAESGFIPQVFNQWIYFRLNSPFDGNIYYTNAFDNYMSMYNFGGCIVNGADISINDNLAVIHSGGVLVNSSIYGLSVYPIVNSTTDICINAQNGAQYKIIGPEEALTISFDVKYKLSTGSDCKKTILFDLRNSLYTDPITYRFTVSAKNSSTTKPKVRRDIDITKLKNMSKFNVKVLN